MADCSSPAACPIIPSRFGPSSGTNHEARPVPSPRARSYIAVGAIAACETIPPLPRPPLLDSAESGRRGRGDGGEGDHATAAGASPSPLPLSPAPGGSCKPPDPAGGGEGITAAADAR